MLSTYFCGLLAQAYGRVRLPKEGMNLLTPLGSEIDPWWVAELYRLKGELNLQRGELEGLQHWRQEAEEFFLRALTTARTHKSKSLELRVAVSLSRLWLKQGRRSEAQEVLASILTSFTEGFGTSDLCEAKMVFEQC